MEYTRAYTEEFLSAYRKLEKIRNDDSSRYSAFRKKHASLFELVRTTRNTLTHDIVKGDYPYLVSKGLLDSLNHLLYLMTVKSSELMNKREHLITAKKEDRLGDLLRIMQEKGLSYLPMLSTKETVNAVVSSKSLLAILNDGAFDPELPAGDLLTYFELENPWEAYRFCAANTYATNAKDIFENASNKKKCHLIFVTEHGLPEERLLGILTPWDVFSLNEE